MTEMVLEAVNVAVAQLQLLLQQYQVELSSPLLKHASKFMILQPQPVVPLKKTKRIVKKYLNVVMLFYQFLLNVHKHINEMVTSQKVNKMV